MKFLALCLLLIAVSSCWAAPLDTALEESQPITLLDVDEAELQPETESERVARGLGLGLGGLGGKFGGFGGLGGFGLKGGFGGLGLGHGFGGFGGHGFGGGLGGFKGLFNKHFR